MAGRLQLPVTRPATPGVRQAQDPGISGSALSNHPMDTELVDAHAVVVTPELALEGHGYLPASGQPVEDPLSLIGGPDTDIHRHAVSQRAWPHAWWSVRAHERLPLTERQGDVHDQVGAARIAQRVRWPLGEPGHSEDLRQRWNEASKASSQVPSKTRYGLMVGTEGSSEVGAGGSRLLFEAYRPMQVVSLLAIIHGYRCGRLR